MDRSRQLVEQASQGDTLARTRLLEEHLPGLLAFLRLRMGARLRLKESCHDLAQSVCREVLEHMDRFQYGGETQFKHWLYSEALRKIQHRAEYYGAAKRDVGREWDPGMEQSVSGVYASLVTPSQEAMGREQREKFEAAFAELSEHYREVITLSRIVGLSHQEIAAAMGRSETATRSLLHRALAELAERLR